MIASVSPIMETLVRVRRRAGYQVGETLAGKAVAVQRAAWVTADLHLARHAAPDRLVGPRRVHDVGAAFPSLLAMADIDDRNAEKSGFADAHARIADQAPRALQKREELLALEVLDETHMLAMALLP